MTTSYVEGVGDPEVVGAYRRAYRHLYSAQQASLRLPMQAAKRVWQALTGLSRVPADSPALQCIESRYRELLALDVRNADEGLYPPALLFQIPFARYVRRLPLCLIDLPVTRRRLLRGDHGDLPRDVDLSLYPDYFRRNFHWQSDGYLSRRSARLYDLGVEILFLGCADVMRRQVIPPISRFLDNETGPIRILDVGCGTGRTLWQIAFAHPGHRYHGIDLSPYYVAEAHQHLARVDGVALEAGNAESLPYRDGAFDVVTSVYLFHELPRSTRRNVLAEMRRVLRPGGLLVLEDSEQTASGAPMVELLAQFSRDMHEPYYADYLSDDLASLLSSAGFELRTNEPCWVARVLSATRS